MSYNYLISILIFTLYLLIPIAFSINDTQLDYICLDNNKPFTSNYNQSRTSLVLDIIIFNPASFKGFRNVSQNSIKNNEQERAYGLALCRGDVSSDDCKACVNNATTTLVNLKCPDSRSAIIWRDYCFFKYSDANFFGKIDISNAYISMSDSIFMSPYFRETARNLMVRLQKVAIASPMLYADEKFVLVGTQYTLYGMVQCTRDLVKDDCKKCLDSAIRELSITKQGARVVYGSCNVRYETYDF
ncbi:hypothetical protein CASFOL_040853 [Castilleja foliolosa]|uniref:Gnk2-homologous domain-containing protein n=1 Tax=Castilleja foliolosa TaxID=1961234 RepID=A0ABD3BD06_9LAMI